jgi:hypothetical protein
MGGEVCLWTWVRASKMLDEWTMFHELEDKENFLNHEI